MKIIRNYKLLKERHEEFPKIELKQYEVVFAEMPLCIALYDYDYDDPYLYAAEGQIPVAMEKNELIKMIEGTKLFFFKVVNGNRVEEVNKEDAEFSYRLPVDTPVEKLAIINGQFGLLEEEEVQEEEGDQDNQEVK